MKIITIQFIAVYGSPEVLLWYSGVLGKAFIDILV
jgi:hypothetical protein